MLIVKSAFVIRHFDWIRTRFLEVFTVDYEQLVKDQELVDEYIRSIGGDRDVAPYVMG